MATRTTISVLVVDDHAVVRSGMQTFLETTGEFEVVAAVATGDEAVAAARRLTPDVAFVDLLMPGMDGVTCTRMIREVSPRTQVIVLTSYHRDQHIFPALQAGALSYLLKDAEPEELAEAARRAARGEATLHPRVAARVIEELRGRQKEAVRAGFLLTQREDEVLRLIAEGLANRTIASRLGIAEKTVKRHVSNILGKLHLDDRTQAAVYAWRRGLVGED